MKTFALIATSIVYFPLGLATLGCQKQTVGGSIENMVPVDNSPKRYLALGDSYTIGQSVQATERFPAQVTAQLRNSGIAMSDPEYIATTGWTTLDLQAGINARNPQGPYDAVSLLIGVNDQYQTHDTTNYRHHFTQLLNMAIALTGYRKEKVFVLSIPDYSATPFVSISVKAVVSMEVNWFNDINKKVTLSYGIGYVDIVPSSREAATNPSLISGDGLHPSGLEYRKWADLLFPLMKEMLK